MKKSLYPWIFLIALLSSHFLLPEEVYADYRVGVDYHATTSDFQASAFITQYQDPSVRAEVKKQLQGMANTGAKVINTRLWLTDPPEHRFPNSRDRLGFPLSAQELANIKQYVQDVAQIKTSDGKNLDLYLTLLWLGCASYRGGYDMYCHYTWDQYITIAKQSVNSFFNAIGDIARPDGSKAVQIVYMDGEIMVGAKENMDKFLTDLYPFFFAKAQSKGITPSVYFIVQSHGEAPDTQRLRYVTETMNFMKTHNLPLPKRIDISFYSFGSVDAVLEQFHTLYPTTPMGVAETSYAQDRADRITLGKTFANSYKKRGIPEEVLFWTTPNSGGAGIHAGYPFDITSFTQNPIPTPTPTKKLGDLNGDGKVNIFDYNIILAKFKSLYTIFDYNTLVANFGK